MQNFSNGNQNNDHKDNDYRVRAVRRSIQNHAPCWLFIVEDAMSVQLLHGDCRDVLKTLASESVHACVTDPPYELGFMGKKWDNTGIAFDVTLWREVLRVLKPGAHLLAFGGTRTHHRMMCAIEDAGLEIRDCLGWLYGSGFPKSHNLDGAWDGWGTALKPAWEPIIMARKPFRGTVAANVAAHGTGAINIADCRVEIGDEQIFATGKGAIPARHNDAAPREAAPIEDRPDGLGRWPANILHDGSDEVLSIFPDAPGQIADLKFDSGARKMDGIYGSMKRGHEPSANSENIGEVGFKMRPGARRLDAGSAARFFYCAKPTRAEREVGLGGRARGAKNWSSGEQSPGTFQSPNTDRTSTNPHPTVKPVELMRYLCKLITPKGGVILDCFMGSGSTGRAADIEQFDFIGIESNPDYLAIAKARIHDAPLFAEVA